MNDLYTSILWILIIIGLLVVPSLVGLATLAILYHILSRIEGYLTRVVILFGLLILNVLVFVWLDLDPFAEVMATFILGIPVSVLIPQFVFLSSEKNPVTFSRTLRCYLLVAVSAILFEFLFFTSGIAMKRFFYFTTPLSITTIFLGFIVGAILIATVFYNRT